MRIGAVAAAAASVALGSAGAQAETVDYFYVSGPAYISNQEDPADRELLNYGWLTVDRDLLPWGPSLANRTISRDFEECIGPPCEATEAVNYSFAWGDYDNITITFDENEEISFWDFDNYFFPASEYTFRSAHSRFGDVVATSWSDGDPADFYARLFLTEKGYIEGTPAYEAQRCGAWTGGRVPCGFIGETSPAWAYHYRADPGTWFKDDPLAFAAQVEAVTRAALANPPRSHHDIAPVPVPAPLTLLAAAIAGLAIAGRASGRRAQPAGH